MDTKKKTIHPVAADGSSQLVGKSSFTVPCGTEKNIPQHIAECNSKRITLEDDLREAARIFHFPETMDAEVVINYLISKGVYTSQEVERINYRGTEIKSRIGSNIRSFRL